MHTTTLVDDSACPGHSARSFEMSLSTPKPPDDTSDQDPIGGNLDRPCDADPIGNDVPVVEIPADVVPVP
jgi:hypothetical protein